MENHPYILWDWNGTLLDDVWLCVDIVNSLLEKRGQARITRRRYHEIFDFPVKGYYEKAGFDFSVEPFESICMQFCDEYAARVAECRLQDGALHALKWCSDNEISQSILSATEQGRLERMVDLFGLTYSHD